MTNTKILLYYKYVDVPNPEEIKTWQKELCSSLGLKGRIIIATEGINGTLGGTVEATDAYINAMNAHPLFDKIDFKESPGSADDFPKLKVMVKSEIVRLGISPQELSHKNGGVHLTPEQTHELLENKPENLVILDTRNIYESKIGRFSDAIMPEIDTFREFPEYVRKNIELFQNKPILVYCTGGVRCERASAFMKSVGVDKVYQIQGGIHRYLEKFPDGFFRGKNFVFDDRIAMPGNEIVGKCDHCHTGTDDYTNCANASCNKPFITCNACLEKFKNGCSENCFKLIEEQKVTVRTRYQRGAKCFQKNLACNAT